MHCFFSFTVGLSGAVNKTHLNLAHLHFGKKQRGKLPLQEGCSLLAAGCFEFEFEFEVITLSSVLPELDSSQPSVPTCPFCRNVACRDCMLAGISCYSDGQASPGKLACILV